MTGDFKISFVYLFAFLLPAINLLAQQVNSPEFFVEEVKGGDYVTGTGYLVSIPDFFIASYEVDQKLWTQVMGYNYSEPKGDKLPANNMTWFEAIEFCNKLSVMMNYPKVYSPRENDDHFADLTVAGIRLPTEAEWEYAAIGGNKSLGYKYSGSNNPDEVAWYVKNSSKNIRPVGTKAPNELGIYDMSGNVCEWTYDLDPKDKSKRIIKGGTWNSNPSLLVPTSSGSEVAENFGDERLGFRVVISIVK